MADIFTAAAPGACRVLYKLDRSGSGEEVALADLPNCPGLPLSGFTSDQFMQLCVMAGCDFLAQLPGIGLKKAHGVLRKYRSFTKVGGRRLHVCRRGQNCTVHQGISSKLYSAATDVCIFNKASLESSLSFTTE